MAWLGTACWLLHPEAHALRLVGTGAHEECERLERLIVRDFRSDAKGHAERLAQGHRVRKMLDQVQAQAEKLVRPMALRWCCLSALGSSGSNLLISVLCCPRHCSVRVPSCPCLSIPAVCNIISWSLSRCMCCADADICGR